MPVVGKKYFNSFSIIAIALESRAKGVLGSAVLSIGPHEQLVKLLDLQ